MVTETEFERRLDELAAKVDAAAEKFGGSSPEARAALRTWAEYEIEAEAS